MTNSIKGSKKWIRELINNYPELLNNKIKKEASDIEGDIEWLSPKVEDNYREYRDRAFLHKLGLDRLSSELKDFWPEPGPSWDGFGREEKRIFIIEAKSHIPEIISTCKAVPESKEKIIKSLEKTRNHYHGSSEVDWTRRFYQYANRLAILHWFRTKHVPAYLCDVYFINDPDMLGPTTESEWKGSLSLLNAYFGLSEKKLQNEVLNIFVDINDLQH